MHILIINGAEERGLAKGEFNQTLVDTAENYFISKGNKVMVTNVSKEYDVSTEHEKFKKADLIIFQYPIFWFTFSSSLKQYIDSVYSYGVFFTGSENYGRGGLMKGKKYMLSTTWHAPESEFITDKNTFVNCDLDTALTPMHKIQQYCAMEPVRSFSCHNVVMNPELEIHKKRYLNHLETVLK